jgi:thiol-disulfide isomerase/thioredoxin
VEQVLLAGGLVVVAVIVAAVLRRRQPTAAPTQPRFRAPAQLDRADFPDPDAPCLVVAFTSSTCHTCAAMAAKAAALQSDQVSVVEVEVTEQPDLHRKYAIEAVPMVLVADAEGAVGASFIGPASATDLWAAVAELRER